MTNAVDYFYLFKLSLEGVK